MGRRHVIPSLLPAGVLLVLVHACETNPVTEPAPPDPAAGAATAAQVQAALGCGEYGDPCWIPPLVGVGSCRVFQKRDKNGKCVCKYEWMEMDEDGECKSKRRPDEGGEPGGGSENDSITFLVRLECDTGLQRGETIRCAAEATDATGPIDYEWRFEPDGGGARVWDGVANLEPLDPVSAVVKKSGAENMWEGKAAHGGVVTVEATDSAGNTSRATSDFTVSARGWRIDLARVKSRFARDPSRSIMDTIRPSGGFALGGNINVAGSADSRNVLEGDQGFGASTTARVVQVQSGPNRGYGYVRSQGYYVDRRYTLNVRLEPHGPVEIPDTTPNDTTDSDMVNHWGYMARPFRQWNPQGLLDGVKGHEGRGANGGKGHQGQIEKALGMSTAGCADAAALADRIVANSAKRAGELVEAAENLANTAFFKAAGHHHVHGNVRSRLVLYDPSDSVPPQPTLHHDVPQPDPTQSDPRCNWGNF